MKYKSWNQMQDDEERDLGCFTAFILVIALILLLILSYQRTKSLEEQLKTITNDTSKTERR